MIRDRLAELQSNCDTADSSLIQHDIIELKDLDPKLADQEIAHVFNVYSDIRDGINEIKSNVKSMRNLLAELSLSPNNDSLPEQMETLRQANIKLCQQLLIKMHGLEKNFLFKDDHEIISRIKRTHFNYVRDDFIMAWREHQQFLVGYKEKVKVTLMRHAKILDQNVSEEEAENLMYNQTTSLFVGSIVDERENARLLRDLLMRHSELTKIEKSLMEVRDMYLQISMLVMEQSTMIQVIEDHVKEATINVDKGKESLEAAHRRRIRVRKVNKMVGQEAKEVKPEFKGFSYYFNSHTNYGRANVSKGTLSLMALGYLYYKFKKPNKKSSEKK